MNYAVSLFFAALACFSVLPAAADESVVDSLQLELLPDEGWYGGLNSDGHEMPFNAQTNLKRDLYGYNDGNQASPLLISDQGRWIWSEKPIRFEFTDGKLSVESDFATIQHGRTGTTLREAFLETSRRFFPPQGGIPDPEMFNRPQYNTWIELMYDQEQGAILEYAQTLVDQEYPKGILMIDDNWQEDYGVWKFSGRRFESPKKMMNQLDAMGFRVMLWVCPFVSPDSAVYRDLKAKGCLLAEAGTDGKTPAMIRWWNGVSAVLDLSNPDAMAWFKNELQHLVDEYGVDGFKLDAGDTNFYVGDVESFKEGTTANDQTEFFGQVGLAFPLNEYRATWKMAGRPLVQRLKDKAHRWDDLNQLIPDLVAQGLLGYAFTCPDMIGGGEFKSFLNEQSIDQELVVRSAQVHALMPMMQFSVAPWRILSEENNAICRRMAELHVEMGDQIVELARKSAETGEPIVQSMEYQYPHQGFAGIGDQFFLGPDILVAPVVENDARSRVVKFPAGKWLGDDQSLVTGPASLEIQVPLSRLPYYRLQP